MLDRRDAVHEGYRKGGMQDRRDVGLEGCRKGGIQERRNSRDEGCKFGSAIALMSTMTTILICEYNV